MQLLPADLLVRVVDGAGPPFVAPRVCRRWWNILRGRYVSLVAREGQLAQLAAAARAWYVALRCTPQTPPHELAEALIAGGAPVADGSVLTLTGTGVTDRLVAGLARALHHAAPAGGQLRLLWGGSHCLRRLLPLDAALRACPAPPTSVTVELGGTEVAADDAYRLLGTCLRLPGVSEVAFDLQRLSPTGRGTGRLLEALRLGTTATTLRTLRLDLTGNRLSPEAQTALCAAGGPALRALDLRLGFTDLDARLLAATVQHLPRLRSLTLGCDRCGGNVTDLALALRACTALTRLDVGLAHRTSFGPPGFGALRDTLGDHLPRLEHLMMDLRRTEMRRGEAEMLCEALARRAWLPVLRLNLGGNRLGEAPAGGGHGPSPLLPLRRLAHTLRVLEVDAGGNDLHVQHVNGSVFVAGALPLLRRITLIVADNPAAAGLDLLPLQYAVAATHLCVDVSRIPVRDHFLPGVASLGRLPAIESLEFFAAGCGLDDRIAQALANVRRCPQIERVTLDLSRNTLTARALPWLVALAAAPSCRDVALNVSHNAVAGGLARFVRLLVDARAALRRLHLDLTATGLGPGDVTGTVGNLGSLPHLRDLLLGLARNPGAFPPAAVASVVWLRLAALDRGRLAHLELDLSHCDLEPDAIDELGAGLCPIPRLGLYLGGNPALTRDALVRLCDHSRRHEAPRAARWHVVVDREPGAALWLAACTNDRMDVELV